VTHDYYRVLDWSTVLCAGLAAFSFWQGIALAVTILAGLMSLTLGAIRIHDRLRYGPARGK
jgi:hypothetical protein